MKNLLTLAENESKKMKINNRDQLKKVFDTLVTLSSNAVALRGHENESLDAVFNDMCNQQNHGNYMQVIGLVARHDPKFKKWLEDHKHYGSMTCPEVQNEMLETVDSTFFLQILKEIKKAGFFSLSLDGSTEPTSMIQCV